MAAQSGAETSIAAVFQSKIDQVLNAATTGALPEAILPLDVGSIIIYSPANLISKRHFYKGLGLTEPVHLSRASYEELEYAYTNHHFEMLLNQQSIAFIKSIARNRSINGKHFIFYIQELRNASKALQSAMKRLIDSYAGTCCFVFPIESMSGIDRGIIDRSCIINLNKYYKCSEHLATDRAIAAFLYQVKSLKPYDVLTGARDLAYRLFHVNCPLARVCKVIAEYFVEDEALYVDVITTMAELERNSTQLHKEIFVYEQVILIAAHKFARLMTPQAKRKASAMLVAKPMVALSINETAPAAVSKPKTVRKKVVAAEPEPEQNKADEVKPEPIQDAVADAPAPKKKTIRLKKAVT